MNTKKSNVPVVAPKTFKSKSEFVRSCKKEMSVKEVVDLGLTHGLVISPGHVYEIRRVLRNKKKDLRLVSRLRGSEKVASGKAANGKAASGKAASGKAASGKAASGKATSKKTPSHAPIKMTVKTAIKAPSPIVAAPGEDVTKTVRALKLLASEIGFGAAIQILTTERQKLQGLLRGA